MGQQLNLVTPLHQATKRDYLARMNDDKIACMKKAKEYGADYWDGDRRFGYGGYRYIPGRWKPVAGQLISRYQLKDGSRVLDVGCGKAHLLYEMTLLLPGLVVYGIDISRHALNEAPIVIRPRLTLQAAETGTEFDDRSIDLVMSLGCLHNLRLPNLHLALRHINRVARQSYVMVEAYRNEAEQFNLECWALTAETIMHVDSWLWLFNQAGYTGDYEFIYFE